MNEYVGGDECEILNGSNFVQLVKKKDRISPNYKQTQSYKLYKCPFPLSIYANLRYRISNPIESNKFLLFLFFVFFIFICCFPALDFCRLFIYVYIRTISVNIQSPLNEEPLFIISIFPLQFISNNHHVHLYTK